ncbi:MAG: hypothetical protein GJ680_03615 [Alteromonadaceae bacterium]|nr:hypothetical protein [Alteromonadaceae bacterium]
MKNKTKCIAISGCLITTGLSAAVTEADTDKTSFNIGGQILPECKVTSFSPEQATSLDLSTSNSQTTANVSVWCNTGQSAANTTYSSANAGYLVDDTGNRIAYNVGVSGTSSELNLTSPQIIEQVAGTGNQGETQDTTVSIIPQVNGLESAGSYSDTIAITVSYN